MVRKALCQFQLHRPENSHKPFFRKCYSQCIWCSNIILIDIRCHASLPGATWKMRSPVLILDSKNRLQLLPENSNMCNYCVWWRSSRGCFGPASLGSSSLGFLMADTERSFQDAVRSEVSRNLFGRVSDADDDDNCLPEGYVTPQPTAGLASSPNVGASAQESQSCDEPDGSPNDVPIDPSPAVGGKEQPSLGDDAAPQSGVPVVSLAAADSAEEPKAPDSHSDILKGLQKKTGDKLETGATCESFQVTDDEHDDPGPMKKPASKKGKGHGKSGSSSSQPLMKRPAASKGSQTNAAAAASILALGIRLGKEEKKKEQEKKKKQEKNDEDQKSEVEPMKRPAARSHDDASKPKKPKTYKPNIGSWPWVDVTGEQHCKEITCGDWKAADFAVIFSNLPRFFCKLFWGFSVGFQLWSCQRWRSLCGSLATSREIHTGCTITSRRESSTNRTQLQLRLALSRQFPKMPTDLPCSPGQKKSWDRSRSIQFLRKSWTDHKNCFNRANLLDCQVCCLNFTSLSEGQHCYLHSVLIFSDLFLQASWLLQYPAMMGFRTRRRWFQLFFTLVNFHAVRRAPNRSPSFTSIDAFCPGNVLLQALGHQRMTWNPFC